MTRVENNGGRNYQGSHQQIKRHTCHTQGSSFKSASVACRILTNTYHHVNDSYSGNHFDETIYPKSKQCQCPIFKTKGGSNDSLCQVVYNGEHSQRQRDIVKFFFLFG